MMFNIFFLLLVIWGISELLLRELKRANKKMLKMKQMLDAEIPNLTTQIDSLSNQVEELSRESELISKETEEFSLQQKSRLQLLEKKKL